MLVTVGAGAAVAEAVTERRLGEPGLNSSAEAVAGCISNPAVATSSPSAIEHMTKGVLGDVGAEPVPALLFLGL